ncbi:MAG TPA: LPXTG cell wall anchor domain-containing protein, partial [Candidatus Saccharimonadales bacterium]|nr:LPXTG cell wall anchor domain-containing protein [Candidatus Saccharimonadales bacterium]
DCEEKPEFCTVKGKEHLPKDSKDCVETPVTPPETPTELPHTGASDGIIAFIGAGSLIAAVGYYVASRRALS